MKIIAKHVSVAFNIKYLRQSITRLKISKQGLVSEKQEADKHKEQTSKKNKKKTEN
jgi:hypothetical protein